MGEIAIFAGKAFVIFLGIGGLAILIAVLAARAGHKPELEVNPLHKKFKQLSMFLKSFTLNKDQLKEEKKKLKALKKQEKHEKTNKRVFVINFEGDTKATQVASLREEVSIVLTNATKDDEVVVKVESPGGMVHAYGLAASQILRIRERGIPLTVCVDKVAASGGYLMACVANQILAAPFAILGSIGVVAQVPNVHRLLKKKDVDYQEYTAGEYKRTISIFGEITPKGEAKFLEQLESTHGLFKNFVSAHRPQLQIDQVATGEYWYGEQAKTLGLIDKIQTSDDYLLSLTEMHVPVFEVKYESKHGLKEKLTGFLGQAIDKGLEKILARLEQTLFP